MINYIMSKFNAWMDKMLVDIDGKKIPEKSQIKSNQSVEQFDTMIELNINNCINDIKLLELNNGESYITESNIRSIINYAIKKKIVSISTYLEKLFKNKECIHIIDKSYCKIMIILVQREALAKSNLNIALTKASIKKYDDENAAKDPKYKRFDDNEEDDDTNHTLDHTLEGIMKVKLELDTDDKLVPQTEKVRAMMEEQKRLLQERRNQYADRKKLMYEAINKYDSDKKKADPNFRSFQEINEAALEEEDRFLKIADETKLKHEKLGREEYKINPNKYRDTSCDSMPGTFGMGDDENDDQTSVFKKNLLI